MGFRGIRVGGVAVLVDVDRSPSGLRGRAAVRRGKLFEPEAAIDGAVQQPTAGATLASRVASVDWYHSIDLGGGLVTPGTLDHRPFVPQVGLPERLDGLRVLDVATYDGFWAFELEKRGAAEVVAVDLARFGDIDLPPRARAAATPAQLAQPLGLGFRIAHEALGSRVRREEISVYDLSPERIGTFDVVFCGNLLLHLKYPIRALERIRSVASGRAWFEEAFHPMLPQSTLRYHGGADTCIWWYFSPGALEQMIWDAGFDDVRRVSQFKMRFRSGDPLWQAVFNGRAE